MSHIDYVFATRAAAEAIRDFCCTVGHEIGAEGAAAGVWAPDPVDFLLDALRARMAAPADASDSHRVEYAVDVEEHIIHALELPVHVVETSGARVLVISDGEDTGWSAHAELGAARIDAAASASREGFAAPRGVAILCGADGALLDFPEGPFAVRYSVDVPPYPSKPARGRSTTRCGALGGASWPEKPTASSARSAAGMSPS